MQPSAADACGKRSNVNEPLEQEGILLVTLLYDLYYSVTILG